MKRIGIRREDKNQWERRTPITPEDVARLTGEHDIAVSVQPSSVRIFDEESYRKAGADICEDLSDCDVIFAVKEIPARLLQKDQTYVYFSHVIKGQAGNMPMLQTLVDGKCTLIDYELISDSNNRRLIFFGRFAGIAGMLDTLWALGQKALLKGEENPFSHLKRTFEYKSLSEATEAAKKSGQRIRTEGLPASLTPLTFGIAGYGNVSKGAQEVLENLPLREITPAQLLLGDAGDDNREAIKIVFKEPDMAEPEDETKSFDLEQYWKSPEGYRGKFEEYLPHLKCLVNCIFWNEQYPRLLTLKWLHDKWANTGGNLLVVGDISCDINGAVEITNQVTTPDKPALTWTRDRGIQNEVYPEGVSVIAVDNLPCELPADSSRTFSEALLPFIPAIVDADFSREQSKLMLPDEIAKAIILHKGVLTQPFRYLEEHLKIAAENTQCGSEAVK